MFGSPIIFLQRLGLATSNLARCWGLPRFIIKSHAEDRVGVAMGYRSFPIFGGSPSIFTQWLKLGTSNLVHRLGLSRPTIKPHPGKSGSGLGLGKFPYIWGFPLLFLQLPRCPLSVSGASCISCCASHFRHVTYACRVRIQRSCTLHYWCL